MLTGFDFDHTMVRIGIMNMLLHGVDTPALHLQDALAESFAKAFPKQASNAFDLVLANPPFTGAVDDSAIDKSLGAVVKTRKTELLFLALMLRLLKVGGRCAVVVPEGVLFSSSKAHQAIRAAIIEENGLDAVISLPAGVFRPYATVQTAILIFTKGSTTKNVWFAKVNSDGFTLDDKRQPIEKSDLPELVKQWKKRRTTEISDRKGKYFLVSRDDLEASEFDLSFNRYQEAKRPDREYDSPEKALSALSQIANGMANSIESLRHGISRIIRSANKIPLRQVAQVNPPAPSAFNDPEAEVDFLPMADVNDDGTITPKQTRVVSEVQNGFTVFQELDTIVAKITPCFENGKIALVSGLSHGAAAGSTEFHVVRPSPAINPRFLAHLLRASEFRFH